MATEKKFTRCPISFQIAAGENTGPTNPLPQSRSRLHTQSPSCSTRPFLNNKMVCLGSGSTFRSTAYFGSDRIGSDPWCSRGGRCISHLGRTFRVPLYNYQTALTHHETGGCDV
ncbi:unnamed protein product [Ectocarpus sp. 6 AP-2014]